MQDFIRLFSASGRAEQRSGTDACAPNISRRSFLNGMAMTAAGALTARRANAQTTRSRRIDVHHHFIPDAYLSYVKAHNRTPGVGELWTLARDLADMDAGGTETAILSVTNPGFAFGERDEIRRVVRECNEAAARLTADRPGRFGSFAALPLADADGSLLEIAHALDTLKADGIGVFSNSGDKWLGHPSFSPIYEELNRRRAIVYVHPATPNCCNALGLAAPNEGAMIEFGTDTARTIADLIFSQTTTRFPDIRWIFSHAGGTMPFLIERFLQGTTEQIIPGIATKGMDYAQPKLPPKGVLFELRRMRYDTAQSTNPIAMRALKDVVPVSQILYGTDFWYRTAVETARGLTTNRVFTAAERQAIDRGNAELLMPRLKRASSA